MCYSRVKPAINQKVLWWIQKISRGLIKYFYKLDIISIYWVSKFPRGTKVYVVLGARWLKSSTSCHFADLVLYMFLWNMLPYFNTQMYCSAETFAMAKLSLLAWRFNHVPQIQRLLSLSQQLLSHLPGSSSCCMSKPRYSLLLTLPVSLELLYQIKTKMPKITLNAPRLLALHQFWLIWKSLLAMLMKKQRYTP